MERSLTGLVLSVALLVGGCGASDQERVRETVQSYFRALADQDGERACELVTPEARRRLEPCAARLAPQVPGGRPPVPRVGAVRVDGETASATVELGAARAPVRLRKVDGEWRVDPLPPAG